MRTVSILAVLIMLLAIVVGTITVGASGYQSEVYVDITNNGNATYNGRVLFDIGAKSLVDLYYIQADGDDVAVSGSGSTDITVMDLSSSNATWAVNQVSIPVGDLIRLHISMTNPSMERNQAWIASSSDNVTAPDAAVLDIVGNLSLVGEFYIGAAPASEQILIEKAGAYGLYANSTDLIGRMYTDYGLLSDPLEYGSKSNNNYLTYSGYGDLYIASYDYPNPVYDGYIATLSISANGQEREALQVYRYDANYVNDPSMIRIDQGLLGTKAVAMVAHRGVDGDGFVRTLSIPYSGTGMSLVETLEFDALNCAATDVATLSSANITMVAYQGDGSDGWLASIWSELDGSNLALKDTHEFDTVYCNSPSIATLGNVSRFVVAYENISGGKMVTVKVDNNGGISGIDSQVIDTNSAYALNIANVSNTIYAISYSNSTNCGKLLTYEILGNGTIGSQLDNEVFDTDVITCPKLYHDAGTHYSLFYYELIGAEFRVKKRTVTILGNGTISNIGSEFVVAEKCNTATKLSGVRLGDDTWALAYTGQSTSGTLATMAANATYETSCNLPVNSWFVANITSNNTDVHFSVNGIEVDTLRRSRAGIKTTSGNVTIDFDGMVRDIAIAEGNLTVASWDFEGNHIDGTTIYDQSGGNDLSYSLLPNKNLDINVGVLNVASAAEAPYGVGDATGFAIEAPLPDNYYGNTTAGWGNSPLNELFSEIPDASGDYIPEGFMWFAAIMLMWTGANFIMFAFARNTMVVFIIGLGVLFYCGAAFPAFGWYLLPFFIVWGMTIITLEHKVSL